MLVPAPFSLAPRRPFPSSKHPCSMYVHAKAKDKKPANKQWKEKMQRSYEKGIKWISMISTASKEAKSKKTSTKANKQKSKQKVVSEGDKCRFGLEVHSFILLKHE